MIYDDVWSSGRNDWQGKPKYPVPLRPQQTPRDLGLNLIWHSRVTQKSFRQYTSNRNCRLLLLLLLLLPHNMFRPPRAIFRRVQYTILSIYILELLWIWLIFAVIINSDNDIPQILISITLFFNNTFSSEVCCFAWLTLGTLIELFFVYNTVHPTCR
jgi:hypothetical protein